MNGFDDDDCKSFPSSCSVVIYALDHEKPFLQSLKTFDENPQKDGLLGKDTLDLYWKRKHKRSQDTERSIHNH